MNRLVLACLFLAISVPARAGLPEGVGALGDSITDEYQFHPERARARNWLELLAEHRGFDFGPFSEESRGEPRNRGYAYDWARSNATTGDMIEQGQHTGLARQVARGDVKLVVVFIGANDFFEALKSPDQSTDLKPIATKAARNVDTALDTILDASPDVRIILITVPDVQFLPEFLEPIRAGRVSPARVNAYSRAIRRFNNLIRAASARDERVVIADLHQWGEFLKLLKHISMFGVEVDLEHPDESLMLDDGRHLGTVAQALLANLVIDVANAEFDYGLRDFTKEEMLDLADRYAPAPQPSERRPQQPSPPPRKTPDRTDSPTPRPARSRPAHGRHRADQSPVRDVLLGP